MTFQQIPDIIAQIATWVTVALVFLTLREMEKQRKEAQKPELIVPNATIFGYSRSNDELFIISWSNKEIKKDGITIGKFPDFTIYNIGLGAAKEIKIKWDFNIRSMVDFITEYCFRNSIPLCVSVEDNGLIIEYTSNITAVNIDAGLRDEHTYLLPASVTPQGLESSLPMAYLELISIQTFLYNHHYSELGLRGKIFSETEEFKLNFPVLSCQIGYSDILGNKYLKKYDVTFEPVFMRFPSKETTFLITDPVFHGMIVFKAKNQ